MFDLDLALRFGAALGLGLLLGIERERKRDLEILFGGVRTLALIALLGALSAFIQLNLGIPLIVLAGFLAVAALIVVSHSMAAARGERGVTTEITALLAFLVGALCVWGQMGVASAATVICLLLLTLKNFLHDLARRVEVADVEATLQFAVISIIVLPLLPNATFGPPPLDVINPYKIWLMVVLLAGVNFTGYVAVKILGGEHGLIATGVLGGLVSSTAATISLSRRSREEPQSSEAFVRAIIIAWTVMFVRVVILVSIANRSLGMDLLRMLAWMAVVGIGFSFILWLRAKTRETAVVNPGGNPLELREALKFGAFFALVTIAAKAASIYFGTIGLYVTGALAGLTDVDAISLSIANLANENPATSELAQRTIMLAVLSNTLMKAAVGAFLGTRPLRRTVLSAAILLILSGIAVIWTF